ncbi:MULTISPECIES: type II toxin-antitoxin system death-on-curing family toxin [unclassified Methanosarcina]|uniref:type II toxin-antitoxin system death-on-curing family toxin n=1 Tax=unclassified Methanosarcina TaxID=2644672 RepID=UPI001E64287C|nr:MULTISPECIES: type II toxin-antitoxin system death-on-curing family toxin [unclassified Methanosarcina]MDY9925976.1 type II toxin-antitoxin system death-on-curing family toxin [Methanosarcina sp.]
MHLEESDALISLIEILKIHQKVIDYDKFKDPDDYTPTIRSLATLELMFEYLIKESNTIFENAAIIVYTIVAKHPFFNGNKRTGYEAMNFIIEDGGYKFTSTDEEMIEFIIRVATTENEMSIEEIKRWIIRHTERI